jgi:hypothetical protein
MDTVGIADIGRLDESELDELLQRSIDPHVPVELFYAVLDRIGRAPAAAPGPAGLEPSREPHPERTAPSAPDATDESAAVALPDTGALLEQVAQLEAAMAGE